MNGNIHWGTKHIDHGCGEGGPSVWGNRTETAEHPELRQELLEAKEAVAVHKERLRCFDFKTYMDRTPAERDKASILLAWLANPTRRGNTIIEIADQSGRSLYRQDEINARFQDYYEQLHKSNGPREAGEIEEYLVGLPLYTLSEEDAHQLGTEISEHEVRVAIKELARGKTLGNPQGVLCCLCGGVGP